MAKAADYSLGPATFPRGWFVVAESSELDEKPLAVRFFDQDFAIYRGESGKAIMLDAYCPHMGTHLAAGDSAVIVQNGEQIEGDSIRCPYHGWRFDADGQCDEIPYHDGPIPRSAKLNSYTLKEVMGCLIMWFDPAGGEPDYKCPSLTQWNDPAWVNWKLDHLGEIAIHPQEILDNMADCQHLGPTHGAPCEYFENEFKDHLVIQRQGGWHQAYDCMLTTATWYTGPGILLSLQQFGPTRVYEIIANTPVEDGISKVWHGVLYYTGKEQATAEDEVIAAEVQAGALQAFAADFSIWQSKRAAIRILQLPKDGPFKKVRDWYKQFYTSGDAVKEIHDKVNGLHHIKDFPQPSDEARELDKGLFD
ncbi:MAG: Rieske 2Fe-2S domain-containing protein [Sinobacterium sp.]|jgi:3-ketosteroid 9alpha-monooxygenase subunit A